MLSDGNGGIWAEALMKNAFLGGEKVEKRKVEKCIFIMGGNGKEFLRNFLKFHSARC